jgi:hypothetical protein
MLCRQDSHALVISSRAQVPYARSLPSAAASPCLLPRSSPCCQLSVSRNKSSGMSMPFAWSAKNGETGIRNSPGAPIRPRRHSLTPTTGTPDNSHPSQRHLGPQHRRASSIWITVQPRPPHPGLGRYARGSAKEPFGPLCKSLAHARLLVNNQALTHQCLNLIPNLPRPSLSSSLARLSYALSCSAALSSLPKRR